MKEEKKHKPTKNPHYDFRQLWYVPTEEEYRRLKKEDEYYEGGREEQFAEIFGGDIYFNNLNQIIEYCKEQYEGEVEYKAEAENQWGRYDNIFVETYQSRPRKDGSYTPFFPSGITSTTAKMWVHQCFDEEHKPLLPFVIPTETLRKWIYENNFKEITSKHETTSKTHNTGVLIPLEFIYLNGLPLPQKQNDKLIQKLQEGKNKPTLYERNQKKRKQEIYNRVIVKGGYENKEDVVWEYLTPDVIKVTYNTSNGEVENNYYDSDWNAILYSEE